MNIPDFPHPDWWIIERAPCYAISRDGVVMRVKPGKANMGLGRGVPGKLIKHCIAPNGYLCVNLVCSDDKWRVFNIHALLGEGFLKKPSPDHYHVAHCDGDKTNFALENLKWKTPKENADDALRHGTRARGDSHGNTKIPDSMIGMIRGYRGNVSQLARDMNVGKSTLYRIRHGSQRR